MKSAAMFRYLKIQNYEPSLFSAIGRWSVSLIGFRRLRLAARLWPALDKGPENKMKPV